ncbi:MAG: T9SS type A sorting domain-containing protein [Bacteroidota bacterium]
MKSVSTFLMMFTVCMLQAQIMGISFEKRMALEQQINLSFLASVPNKNQTYNAFEKSNVAEWKKSANEVIADGHRIYSLDMVDDSVIWIVSTLDRIPPLQTALPFVLKSLDGGRTWEQFSIPNTEGFWNLDVAGVSDKVAYVTANDVNINIRSEHEFLYKTEDGGETWQAVESYPYTPTAVHFFDENRGFAIGPNENSFTIFSITEDGGETWDHAGGNITNEDRNMPETDSTELIGTWGFSFNSVYEAVDSVILLGTSKRYWISEDYGRNWEAFESPLAPARVVSMVAMKNRDTFMLASNVTQDYSSLIEPLTYTTTDGGETWTVSTPPGHLAAIHYLPGTQQSFISVGHRNFGVGEVGTYRTDDFENWEKVDDLPLIAMDFAGENQGTGVLGNIPPLGDNGNIYKWEAVPLYGAAIDFFEGTEYTISTKKHTDIVVFDYGLTNIGQLDLSEIRLKMQVDQNSDMLFEQEDTITTLETGEFDGFSFEYTPLELGKYDYRFFASSPDLGENFDLRTYSFELNDTTLAKEDGTPEHSIGFGLVDSTWYGYYGNEFELEVPDTLRSISIAVSTESEETASFNLTITRANRAGVVSVSPIYNSGPIPVATALEGGGILYTHVLEEPLILEDGLWVFAAGQDVLQGIVAFGFDGQNINDTYWIESPVANGGFRWTKSTNNFRPTLIIRPNFVGSGIVSSTEEIVNTVSPLQIFPNPFADQLYLRLADTQKRAIQMQLIDIQGKIRFETKIDKEQTQALNGEHLASGIYFMRVTDGEQTWVEKVVKP